MEITIGLGTLVLLILVAVLMGAVGMIVLIAAATH
jgi:hypothetical protein